MTVKSWSKRLDVQVRQLSDGHPDEPFQGARGFVVMNFFFFQFLWLSSVAGAGGNSMHWLALLALVPITVLTAFGRTRRSDWIVAGLAAAVGYTIDNLWVYADILSYPAADLAPYWIAFLWYGLGLTINHSLAWFRDRTVLGPLLVGLFAPVTYLTGEQFGAVEVVDLEMTAVIAASWAVLFAVLSKVARWAAEREFLEELS